jgi:hypothetical protein
MEDTVGRVVADFGAVTFISNRQQVANLVRLQRESAALVATQWHALAEAVWAGAVAKAATAAVVANAELQAVERTRAVRLQVADALPVERVLMCTSPHRRRKEP